MQPMSTMDTSQLSNVDNPPSNAEYSPDGKAAIDKIDDDDDDDDFEHNDTSPLISQEQDSQPQTRQHLRLRHMVPPGRSYSSTEDTQPLLEKGEGDEDTAQPKTTSSTWFNYFSVHSVISYLMNLGSSIGSSLLYYISGVFHRRAEPEPTNT